MFIFKSTCLLLSFLWLLNNSPFPPRSPSQRGKDATNISSEALGTSPSAPRRGSTLKLAPEEDNADPRGRTLSGGIAALGTERKRTEDGGRRSDTEKQSAGTPGCHKAQSSTAKWQKGRIKHPSI